MRIVNRHQRERGFSLLEVTVATGLMAGALVSLAHMLAVSVMNNRLAQASTYTAILAAQKLEQLRGLAWGFDNTGLPISDTTSDVDGPIDLANGGTGLSPSPQGTMTTNTAGWVDYVDQFGNVLGGGAALWPKTAYVRRWGIEPLSNDPDNALLLHVLVTTHANRGVADRPGSTTRLPAESRIVTVKTRKAQ